LVPFQYIDFVKLTVTMNILLKMQSVPVGELVYIGREPNTRQYDIPGIGFPISI
jgi:hypothetical protein